MCKRVAYILGSVILIFLSLSVKAQRRHGDFQRPADRIFYGGSLGLTIGSQITQVDVVPMVGMWVLPQWSVGVGGRYTYRKERFSFSNGTSEPYETHIWGASGFTEILPVPDFYDTFGIDIHGGIVIHGEYEGLYLDKKLFDNNTTEGRGWVNMYLVGGGWRQRLGDKAAMNFLLLWDLTDSRYSPYTSNPILRFSITF
ncbi:MAG: hypothetical protein AB7S48_01710 [Bacteroidales bacterium]